VADESRPAWHWDEQAALRAELADQAEAAATVAAALRAEVERLEREKSELADNVNFWRKQAEDAADRERLLRLALARQMRKG
jgi:hypothetical protein